MNLVRLVPEDKYQAVETLVAAFYDYPVMRYVLKTSGEEYDAQVRSLIGFFCEARFAKNGHVIGIRGDGNFASVALVDEAFQMPWPNRNEELARLKERIGSSAFERLELYEEVSSDMELKEPHFFLGMIGVRPEYRGRGHAGMLLDYVKSQSVNDQRSIGVCLSTETSKNVPLYEHFGYRTIAEAQIAEMHSWCMFLSTSDKERKT
jgi:ribosomal protein S18 acetylase RimI-like enzyme